MKILLVSLVLLGGSAFAAERLTLADALKKAHDNHPTLRNAEANLEVLRARQSQALGPMLPQINATAQYLRAQGTYSRVSGGGAGAPATATPSNLFSFGLNGSQLLWDFGVIERFRAAGYVKEAQEATVRATELQISLGVRQAYFNASAQLTLLKVFEQIVANSQFYVKAIEGLVSASQRTAIDVAQAKTQLANAQLNVINARNQYQVALANLNAAIGARETQQWVIDEVQLGAIEGEEDPLDNLVKRAVESRPEIVALRRTEQAWAAQSLAAIGGYMPTLSLTGAISEAGQNIEALQFNWSFGVLLNWNLVNGGLTTGLYREALHQREATEALLDVQLLQVRVDVETAQATIRNQAAAVEAAQVAVDAATAQLKLAEAQLKVGLGTTIVVTDAQTQFANAQSLLVQANMNLSTARAQLLAALGVPYDG
ncbi:MAG: TolC family protein [Archangium sp.]